MKITHFYFLAHVLTRASRILSSYLMYDRIQVACWVLVVVVFYCKALNLRRFPFSYDLFCFSIHLQTFLLQLFLYNSGNFYTKVEWPCHNLLFNHWRHVGSDNVCKWVVSAVFTGTFSIVIKVLKTIHYMCFLSKQYITFASET